MTVYDAPLPDSFGKELRGALGKPNAGIRGDEPDALQPAVLEMLEECAPASLVLLRPLANAEDVPIAALIHADRNQQRDVAHLASPAALEHDAVEVNIGVLARDRPIAFQPYLAGLGLQLALIVARARVPTRLAALIASRIAQPVRFGLEQGVQCLLHAPSHDPVEVALDPRYFRCGLAYPGTERISSNRLLDLLQVDPIQPSGR